jgi:hypothetical protein
VRVLKLNEFNFIFMFCDYIRVVVMYFSEVSACFPSDVIRGWFVFAARAMNSAS